MTETHCDCGRRFMAIVADARLCVCGRRYERRNGYWMVTRDTAPPPEVDLYQAFSNASNSVSTAGTVLTQQTFMDAVEKLRAPQNPFYGVSLLTTNLAPPSAFNYSSVPTSGASVGPACITCRRDWLKHGAKWNTVPPRGFIADGQTRYRLLGGREFVITEARVCHHSHRAGGTERYARVCFVTVAGCLTRIEHRMRFSKLSRAVPSNVLWRGSAKDVNKQPVHYELRAEGREFVIEARRANVYDSSLGLIGSHRRPTTGYRQPWQIDATTGTRDTVLACVPDALLESATKAVMKWEARK